jgi:hypothetical protein|tara:strand:- start:674 stop:841 length:168 start_codon:yes stop_codon:yes gene_type:complete
MNNATTRNFTGGKKTLPEMDAGFFTGRKLSICEKKETKGGEPPNVSALLILRLSV